jgi:hypothetical protein
MSRVDDLVTELEAAFDDSTVGFQSGSLCLNRHATRRQIIFVRQRGVLSFVSAPGARPESIPVGGEGTLTKQRFQREESFLITLRAENESELDDLFDRFVNVVFETYGPNAFSELNAYDWHGEDSQNARAYERRNPAIRLLLNFRLASRSDPSPYVQVASTTADVGIPDDTAADAPTVVNP